MITRVHHVGVVVRTLATAYPFWRDTLGLPVVREGEVPDQGVRAALLACGPGEIELLEPTAEDTGVARFLARRGEGLHHLCLESDDVAREVKRLWATGVGLIDSQPRKGLAGHVAFVHPRSCAGVLVELATPIDAGPLPKTMLALSAVHLIVEDVRSSSQLYRDLFGVAVFLADPEWRVAQLTVGAVTLQFASTTTTSGSAGLSTVRLSAADVGAVATRLEGRGLPYRTWSRGLVLGPGGTSGVPLIIQQLPT